ncbi:MAG: hypothetical protein ACD_9C00205G0004 [uncultured bacterium]|nr:MAG: hypothetical protein ACD_9C00205G0004 [uncultured bacterium]
MQWKTPKNTDKYLWTAHVSEKMHYYGLSEQKILGVIRNPKRIETGIVENTVAVMVPVGNIKKGNIKPKWGRPAFGNFNAEKEISKEKANEESWNQEIWVMYQLKNLKFKISNLKLAEKKDERLKKLQDKINTKKQITIISAWRYPGISPKSNPIPEEILKEIEEIAFA